MSDTWHQFDNWWRGSRTARKYGHLYKMHIYSPPSQTEPIVVYYPEVEPYVSSWIDEASEERWPVTPKKLGWWMLLPPHPGDQT